MAYNKVIKRDGTVKLDLTQDTVHESHVKEGITFHNAHGEIKIGTFAPQEKIVTKNGDVIPDEGKYLSKVIVNVAGGSGNSGGIIDVTELPTENIDENVIYRVAEEKNEAAAIYVYHPDLSETALRFGEVLGAMEPSAIIIDTYTEVDVLPDVMDAFSLDTTTLTITLPVYIVKSTGVGYVSQDGTSAGTITCGMLFNSAEMDKGYIDSIESITEPGAYAVRGEVYTVYHYWRYDGSAWSESIPAVEVNELPTEDIQRNTCYILLDTTDGVETERYFIYKGQWVEYLAPKGEITADANGTYDVSKYSTAIVDAAGALQEKTITSNGEVLPDEGYDGFSKVTVDVQPKLQEKTITENGTVVPDTGYDGLSKAIINVLFKLQEKKVIENGEVVPDTGYVGLSKVIVDTPLFALQEKNVIPIKAAQEIIADDGYDALSRIDLEAIPDEYMIPDGTLAVFENGAYDITNYRDMAVAILTEGTSAEEEAEILGKTIASYANSEITTIGDYAFTSCTSLTAINLPEVTMIGNNTFQSCTSLTSIDLPKVTMIGDNAFHECDSLTSADLLEVTTIGKSAFANCNSLTSVSLPKVTTIRVQTFYGCASLVSVNLPEVTSIGTSTFNFCRSLTSIDLPMAISIGYAAFSSCTKLASVNLPKATTIQDYAFGRCDSLTSIDLPNATTINDAAFFQCTALTSVSLPMVTNIASNTFYRCYNLSSLILGASSVCTLVHSNAFTSTPYAGYSASFSGTPYIYVPASLVSQYKKAYNWNYFASYFSAIEDMPTT